MNYNAETMLVFAARYAHNRNIGAALTVVSSIIDQWPNITISTREQLVREAREAEYNKPCWKRLADLTGE